MEGIGYRHDTPSESACGLHVHHDNNYVHEIVFQNQPQ